MKITLHCFIILFLGSCSLILKDKIERDYSVLKTEQLRAHENRSKNFDFTLKEVRKIKPLLLKIIKEKYSDNFSSKEHQLIEVAFTEDLFKDSEDLGSPVFHNFHGNWLGVWKEGKKVKYYHHTWYKPVKENNIIIQKVIIGDWDRKKKKRINEIAAINSYNQASGRIFGAVDINRKTYDQSQAPHIGFYINPYTLIWIARFTDEENPYYSLYYEKIDPMKKPIEYKIKGIGFHWNSLNQKIFLHHWKEGKYLKQLD